MLVAVATLVELKDRLVLGETVAALSWLTYAKVRRPPGQRDIFPNNCERLLLFSMDFFTVAVSFVSPRKTAPTSFVVSGMCPVW